MFRWRMLRHGAHQVKRPSLSGSTRAPEVDEAAADDPLDERALLRQLADRARLPFLRMDVPVGARDVHVAAQDAARARPAGNDAAYPSIASRKRILAGKSLPPFGT